MSVPHTDWIGKWARYSPDKVAIRETEAGIDISYAALNAMAERMAGRLHHGHGLKHGDRIAVLSSFCIPLIALFSAAQKAGFVLVPINTRLTPREVAYQVKDAGAKLLIAEPEFAEKAALLEDLPKVQDWAALSEPNDNTYSAEVQEDDLAFILYTSGTTGFPKGAMYTHKMLFWNSINTQLRLDLHSADVTLNCMPAFHTGGWNVLITPMLHHGASVWLMRNFEPGAALRSLEESSSTLFMAVPTMLKMLSDDARFAESKLECIRYFIVGGEALPIPVIEQWAEKGIPIRQGYGLTEVGPNVTSLHHNDTLRKRGSIGFPNFYIDTRIVKEAGDDCPPDEVGELWLKGPNVSPGYWNNEAANAESYTDGWFKTGDLLRADAEGYLYVEGRKKEMYISGGENVYPREVEKVLQEHPAVAEAAVVGVPHERWGEAGAAFLSLKSPATEAELLSHCRAALAKFKCPKHFIFREELPKNATGKIDKNSLKTQFTNQHKHKSQ
ncbi:MAG: long-chain fatty acid--CoA ligase [Flavobacteriales bacterium]|nr:long-chain fatty acid--CoA ligase [Flavobacteriales bacterium]